MMRFAADFAALVCIATAAGLFAAWQGDVRATVQRRLREVMTGEEVTGSTSAARPQNGPSRFLPRFAARKIAQAGLRFSGRAVLFFECGVFGAGLALLSLFGPEVAAVSCVLAALLGACTIHVLARRRRRCLSVAMRGYFERVRQLLVTGLSLSNALQRAAVGSHPIIVEAFAPAMRRIANGAGFADSIGQLADEVDLYEMRLFAVAVGVHVRFGGSLTGVVAELIENIRRRAAVEREMRAATSQIRTSAWVLALLPLLVACLVVARNPDYARWFLDTGTGRTMLAYSLLSQCIGAFVMRQMIRASY